MDAPATLRRGEHRPQVGEWVALIETNDESDTDRREPVGVVTDYLPAKDGHPARFEINFDKLIPAHEYGYVPMPWDIELRCRAIRRGWTPAERARRRPGRVRWELPEGLHD